MTELWLSMWCKVITQDVLVTLLLVSSKMRFADWNVSSDGKPRSISRSWAGQERTEELVHWNEHTGTLDPVEMSLQWSGGIEGRNWSLYNKHLTAKRSKWTHGRSHNSGASTKTLTGICCFTLTQELQSGDILLGSCNWRINLQSRGIMDWNLQGGGKSNFVASQLTKLTHLRNTESLRLHAGIRFHLWGWIRRQSSSFGCLAFFPYSLPSVWT